MGRSRDELKVLAQTAGWSLSNLAWRWQISVQHLSRLFANQDRPVYWEDAVVGLPRLSRADAARIRQARLAATEKQRSERAQARQAANAKRPNRGFIYRGFLVPGSVVVVVTRIHTLAEVGDEGVVTELRELSSGEDYLIRFDGGEKWFTADTFAEHLAETGREVPL